MYTWFKEYFSVSKREFNGMVVLMIILLLVYLSPYVYEKFYQEPVKVEVEIIESKIKLIEDKSKNRTYAVNYEDDTDVEESNLFNFDPNKTSFNDWMKLGLSKKQASVIVNYTSKGGKFRKKEDLKKIYSISENDYNRLQPYIKIDDYKSGKEASKYISANIYEKTASKKLIMVDINMADSLSLTEISGIGPAFASRIIKYRERLGGFVNKEQLREVYGIDSAKFNQITDQIKINAGSVNKININTAVFEELKKFPYLSFKQMNAIIAFRKQHGNYKDISDLDKITILTPAIIKKIEPYFQF